MVKESIFKDFTNLYPVTKTLRFELKPVDENGKEKDVSDVMGKLIEQDKQRGTDITTMKGVLNILHRNFIKSRLSRIKIKEEDLKELFENVKEHRKAFENLKKTEEYEEKSVEDKKTARQGLSSYKKMYGTGNKMNIIKSYIEDVFKEKDSEYEDGFKTLIGTDNLKKKINKILDTNNMDQFTEEQRKILKSFDFYGALGDYAKNRENYYTNKGKSTEIIYRIVNDNLHDRYIDNVILSEKEMAYKEIIKKCDKEYLFKIENYSNYLLQEDITQYNECIGEINQEINKENQNIKERNQASKKDKDSEHEKIPKLKFFKEMYKQIGSEQTQKRIYDIPTIQDSDDLLSTLLYIQKEIDEYIEKSKDYFGNLVEGVEENPSNYFVSKRKISTFSANILGGGSWNFFRGLLGKEEFLSFKDIGDYFRDEVSVDDIKTKTSLHKQEWFNEKDDINTVFLSSIKYRFSILIDGGSLKEYSKDEKKFIDDEHDSFKKLREIFDKQVDILKRKMEEKDGRFNKRERKEFIDGVQDTVFRLVTIDRFLRNFEIQEEIKDSKITDEDSKFYNGFHDKFLFSEDVPRWHKTLDSLRNYLTKNGLDDVNRIRLWFDKSDLLEKQSNLGSAFLINNQEEKYLAICCKGTQMKKFLCDSKNYSQYKLLRTKQMDWRTLAAGYNKKYNKGIKVKNGTKEMIKNMQEYLELNYIKKYPEFTSIINNKNIDSTDQLKKDIDKVCDKIYGLSYEYLDTNFLKCLKEDKILLFKITSRDLRGKNTDSQSIFINYLFSKENIENPIVKMCGNGMVFFREPTDDLMKEEKEQIKTENGKIIKFKEGKGDEVYHKKRFYNEKMFVHFPIELNTGVTNVDVDKKVKETIKEEKEIKVLGIDRGENNLLYCFLLDKEEKGKGESLNELEYTTNDGEKRKKDFHTLLTERENERRSARQKWSANIPDIKNLKKGYLSWVLKEIVDFAVQENAIIVLEGLNKGFIGGRRYIEKNIYSQFQKGLADKLNFLMIDDDPKHALQLTPNITSYLDIEKAGSKGILFFVMPSYTSVTCPNCGWRNRKSIDYKSIKQSIKDFSDIQINWEEKESRFKFSFTVDKIKDGIYSDVDRYFYDKEKHGYIKRDAKKITEELKGLFEKNKVDISGDITGQIKGFNERSHKKFWEELIYLFNMISRIRNKTEDRDDFILCPSCHFDTRDGKGKLENGTIIKNGDSNGAYNIARRGRMLLDKINKSKSPNLNLKLTDWDKHVRGKNTNH